MLAGAVILVGLVAAEEQDCSAADGEWRSQTSSTKFVIRDGEVWQQTIRTIFSSDENIAPLVTTNLTQISGLSPANESHKIVYDVRGNATEKWTSFENENLVRKIFTRAAFAANVAMREEIDGECVAEIWRSW